MMQDRLLFYREKGANAYGAEAYFISSSYVTTFTSFQNAVVFTLILYFMVGFQNTLECFGFFFIFILLSTLNAQFVAKLVAAVSPSSQVGMGLFIVVLVFNNIFSGYVVYIPQMQNWLSPWSTFFSFARFAFQGMVLNEVFFFFF
jgi:ABC-type multidrug transport system permease subunit